MKLCLVMPPPLQDFRDWSLPCLGKLKQCIGSNNSSFANNVNKEKGTCTYFKPSSIFQVDGNISIDDSDNSSNSSNDDHENDGTNYDTDDEVDPQPIPANFYPIPGQNVPANQPLQFDVNLTKDAQSSSLPLFLMMNCRSVCNKVENLREMLNTIGPLVTMLSETWEREK